MSSRRWAGYLLQSRLAVSPRVANQRPEIATASRSRLQDPTRRRKLNGVGTERMASGVNMPYLGCIRPHQRAFWRIVTLPPTGTGQQRTERGTSRQRLECAASPRFRWFANERCASPIFNHALRPPNEPSCLLLPELRGPCQRHLFCDESALCLPIILLLATFFRSDAAILTVRTDGVGTVTPDLTARTCSLERFIRSLPSQERATCFQTGPARSSQRHPGFRLSCRKT